MSNPDGKKIIEESKNNVKNKIKKERKENMKKITQTQAFKTIVTVLLTIAVMAAIAGLLYVGFAFGRDYESGLQAEISAQVKESVAIKSSKE